MHSIETLSNDIAVFRSTKKISNYFPQLILF